MVLYHCGWRFNGKLVRVVKRKIPVFLTSKRYHVPSACAGEGAELLVGFNDTFFMPLMFFLSALFAW